MEKRDMAACVSCADPVATCRLVIAKIAFARRSPFGAYTVGGAVHYAGDAWSLFTCSGTAIASLSLRIAVPTAHSTRMFHPGQSETRVHIPEMGICDVKQRLRGEFLDTIRQVTLLLSQQSEAVIEWDSEFSRFDVPLHLAQQNKEAAKYALIAHIEAHHCEEA